LGFGDTDTDQNIADVFRKLLKGQEVAKPDYEFLYDGVEPTPKEKDQIASVTHKVTVALQDLVDEIEDELTVDLAPAIIEWMVEEFYGILH
jgi:hypothetical protein